MECIEPGAIRDEELLAYLAGERVRPVVAQHLTKCQHCSSQLANYRQVELMLTSKLYRWDCPPNQVLGEYHLGLLRNDLAVAVKMHLATCVLCTAEVAALTEFLAGDPALVERPQSAKITVLPSRCIIVVLHVEQNAFLINCWIGQLLASAVSWQHCCPTSRAWPFNVM